MPGRSPPRRTTSTRALAALATGAVGAALVAAGCGPAVEDARTAEIASVMVRADLPLLRTRPSLVAGKYARMAADPYAFFRGTVPLYLHDFRNDRLGIGASAFAADAPLVLSLGDAHFENFGVLIGQDGVPALEPNDFDGADRTAYLWDVRRLAVTMALVARLSNTDDADAQAAAVAVAPDLAFAAARSYAATMRALANGAPRTRVVDPEDSEILVDLFERSAEDTAARTELEELTTVESGARRLRRGNLDPEEPDSVALDLPAWFLAALPAALDGYRGALIDPPAAGFFEVLDAVRELGGGIASYPRVRTLVLVRGPSDDPGDDVILELKELPDSAVLPHAPPEVAFDTVQDRILTTSRAAWAVPSAAPLWGTSEIAGMPVQVRLEAAGQKTLRVRRLRGKRGTPEALADIAVRLGAILARIHAAPLPPENASPAEAIAAITGDDPDAFAADHAAVADVAAAEVLLDFARFGDALDVLGPTLGVLADPADAPSADLAALYDGVPPSP
ncbi:MAG: DUF2252 family protein [Polyangiaceae bacterium]